MPIKLAIGAQCLAWSFQLPYVPLFLQEDLNASKVQIAAIMAMQVGIQVIIAPTALGYCEQHGKTLELTVAAWVLSAIGVGMLAMSTTITGAAFSFAVWAVGGMIVCPLNDSACLQHLGAHKSEYGKQRLWGAVTWGLGNAVAGSLVRRVGFRTTSIIAVVLHLVAGGFAADLRSKVLEQALASAPGSSSSTAGGHGAANSSSSNPSSNANTMEDSDTKRRLWPAFTTSAALLFLTLAIVCSSYFAAIQSYLFLWLADLEVCLRAPPFLSHLWLTGLELMRGGGFVRSGDARFLHPATWVTWVISCSAPLPTAVANRSVSVTPLALTDDVTCHEP